MQPYKPYSIGGAFKKNFGKSWDFVPRRGAGVWPNPNFFKPKPQPYKRVILMLQYGGGSPVPTKNHIKNHKSPKKMGLFHEKIICLESLKCKKKSQRNHPFVWLWFWFEKVGIRSETHPPRWAKITYFTKKWFWRLPSSASAALSCVKPAPPAALTNRDKDLLLPPVNVKMAIGTNKDVYGIV